MADSFQYLYLIPITTAVVGAILVVFFKRWYAKVCERQDRRDRVFYRTIRKVDAMNYAVAEVMSEMNGHGHNYRRLYAEKLAELEKEEVIL